MSWPWACRTSPSSTGRMGTPSTRLAANLSCSSATPAPTRSIPAQGERYPDVIVFWVPSESDKQALVQDRASPFFTTSHFDGHLSVLVRGEPDRRTHPAGTGRAGPGSLALPSLSQESRDLAQRASLVAGADRVAVSGGCGPTSSARDVVPAAGVAADQALSFEHLESVGCRLACYSPFLGECGDRRRWLAGL